MIALSWADNWCESSDRNIKYTMKKIMKKTRTKSCKKALKILRVQESFDLSKANLRDIRPLSEAKQSRVILLRGNKALSNIKPLQSLSHLQWLDLSETAVEDIEPLRGLQDLRTLWLSNTKIKDIQPILTLKKLQYLSVTNIGLQDIRPFRQLPRLKFFGFALNEVKDLRPLDSFGNKLKSIDIFGNKIDTCPDQQNYFFQKCERYRKKSRSQ